MKWTTPSEVLLGRKLPLPAVGNYPIGVRNVFRSGTHFAMYVVRKVNFTAWLNHENTDGSERTILTSTTQVAPFPSRGHELRSKE